MLNPEPLNMFSAPDVSAGRAGGRKCNEGAFEIKSHWSMLSWSFVVSWALLGMEDHLQLVWSDQILPDSAQTCPAFDQIKAISAKLGPASPDFGTSLAWHRPNSVQFSPPMAHVQPDQGGFDQSWPGIPQHRHNFGPDTARCPKLLDRNSSVFCGFGQLWPDFG